MSWDKKHHKHEPKPKEEKGLTTLEALRLKAEELRHDAKAEYKAAEVEARAQHNHKGLRKARHRYHEELHALGIFLHEDSGGL